MRFLAGRAVGSGSQIDDRYDPAIHTHRGTVPPEAQFLDPSIRFGIAER